MTDLIILALAALTLTVGLSIVHLATTRRLAALRRNAFVTNEKGHRVRYVEASAAVRARAEK